MAVVLVVAVTPKAGAQAITHSGNTAALSIMLGHSVIVDGVTFLGGAVSGVTTLTGGDNVTLSKEGGHSITHTASEGGHSITHSASAGNLTIASSSNTAIVDGVAFAAGAVTGVSTLDANDDVTLPTVGAQATTHSDNTGALSNTSGHSVLVDGVMFLGGTVSGVITLAVGDDATLSKEGAHSITHSASEGGHSITHSASAGNLTIASSSNTAIVDGVAFAAGAVMGVSTLDASDDVALPTVGAQAITHSGNTGALSTKSGHSVIVDGVPFLGGAVSGVTYVCVYVRMCVRMFVCSVYACCFCAALRLTYNRV